MAIIDALKWIISADGNEFRKELDRNDKALRKSNKKLTSDFGTLKRDISGLRNQVLAFVGVGGLLAFSNGTLKTADEVGKLAKQLGTTSEELSTLTFATTQSGASQDDLRLALRRTARGIDQAEQGVGTYGKKLQELGIATRDSNGEMRSSTDVLKDIGDLFKTLPDGPTKTALAFELLGDNGQRLVPLLNEGSAGMAALQDRARELGLEISTKTAEDAAYFNDRLAELKGSVQGLGNTIISDALPHLNEMTKEIQEAYQQTGILEAAWVALGGLGDALYNPSAQTKLKRLKNDLADAEAELRRLNASGALMLGELVKRNDLPRKIKNIKTEIAGLEKQQAEIDANEAKRSEEKKAREAAEAQARRDAAKALEEERKQHQQALTLETARKRAAEDAAKEAQNKIKRGEDAVAGLEREINLFEKLSTSAQVKYDIEQGQYADLSVAHQQRLVQLAQELDALEKNRKQKEESDRLAVAAAKEEEQIRQQLFDQTRTQAEAREIELERLHELRMRGVIDEELYQRAVKQTSADLDTMATLADQATRNMQDAFAEFLFDPFSEGIDGMVLGFANAMRRMVAEALAAQAVSALISAFAGGVSAGAGNAGATDAASGSTFAAYAADGGLIQAFADGGPVSGPGTSSSDSIPARLSNGEFVQPASSTSYYGADFMEALRRRDIPSRTAQNLMADIQRHSPRVPQLAKFAEGGMAQGGSSAAAAPQSMRFVLVDDRSNIGDYITSPEGEKSVMVALRRNSMAVRKILGG